MADDKNIPAPPPPTEVQVQTDPNNGIIATESYNPPIDHSIITDSEPCPSRFAKKDKD